MDKRTGWRINKAQTKNESDLHSFFLNGKYIVSFYVDLERTAFINKDKESKVKLVVVNFFSGLERDYVVNDEVTEVDLRVLTVNKTLEIIGMLQKEIAEYALGTNGN